MMQPIDTGKRRVNVQCDMFGIIANRAHYKEFKGPGAQQEAEVFMTTRALQKRGYIEVVKELPKIIMPSFGSLPALDEDAELTRLAGELTLALRAKKTPDSTQLRRKLFALQKLLSGRLA